VFDRALFSNWNTQSVKLEFITGTLTAWPSSFPFNSGKIKPIAFALPVEVGCIESIDDLALLKSLCGLSKSTLVFVGLCIVVI
jgi:hypothetical protein